MFCRRVITFIFISVSFCLQNAFTTWEKTHVSCKRLSLNSSTVCSYLSEPVDGVKKQRTEELPLSFWQALDFLHHIQVCQDHWAPCDRPSGNTKTYIVWKLTKENDNRRLVFSSSFFSPKSASISSRSPWCCFSSQSLRRRKNGDKHRGDTCLWKSRKQIQNIKRLHSYLLLRTKQRRKLCLNELSVIRAGVTDFGDLLVWVCCSPLFWVSSASRGSRLMAMHPWLSSSSRLYITWAGRGKELKQKEGITCCIYLDKMLHANVFGGRPKSNCLHYKSMFKKKKKSQQSAVQNHKTINNKWAKNIKPLKQKNYKT